MNTHSNPTQPVSGENNSIVIERFLDIYDVGSVIQGLGDMYRSYIADQEVREHNSDEQLQRSYSNNSFLVQEITLLILALDKEHRARKSNPIQLISDVN